MPKPKPALGADRDVRRSLAAYAEAHPSSSCKVCMLPGDVREAIDAHLFADTMTVSQLAGWLRENGFSLAGRSSLQNHKERRHGQQ